MDNNTNDTHPPLSDELARLRQRVAELELLKTQSKQIEQALRKQHEEQKALFDALPAIVWYLDDESRVQWGNQFASVSLGLPLKELVGQTVFDLFPEREAAKFHADNLQVIRSGRPKLGIIESYLTSAGETRWARTDKFPYHDEAGYNAGVIVFAVDMTDQKRAAETLQERESLLASLYKLVPTGICLNDENGNYVQVNDSYCRMYGFSREELIGHHFTAIMPPGEAEPANAAYARLLKGDMGIPSERKRMRKDGSLVYIRASNALIVREDGHRLVITAAIDITERIQAEESLRDYAAELQARNEDLDAFAHTVAHDLKNPVGLVIGYAELLQQDAGSIAEADRRRSLQTIIRSGRKINSILNELLLLAQVRKADLQLEPLNMASIITEVQMRLEDMLEDSEAVLSVPSTWPAALGHAGGVEEVWVNYISNAIQYGGRPPKIELGADSLADGMRRFWVRDNGDGLTQASQQRLFTPFTRLDQAHAKGHRLGLSIVRRIVEKLGGQAGVESEGVPGQGSLFFFTLPAA